MFSVDTFEERETFSPNLSQEKRPTPFAPATARLMLSRYDGLRFSEYATNSHLSIMSVLFIPFPLSEIVIVASDVPSLSKLIFTCFAPASYEFLTNSKIAIYLSLINSLPIIFFRPELTLKCSVSAILYQLPKYNAHLFRK